MIGIVRAALWVGLVFGLLPAAVLAKPAVAPAPYLWEVRSGSSTHYLLGSVHLLPKAAHPLPVALEAAYRKAGTLVFESDLAALQSAEIQKALLSAASGRGLREEVPAELYAEVAASASRRGLAANICDPYTAWFCAMLLEIAAFNQQDFGADHGIDQTFFERGRADKKTITWLETPRAHIGIFTQMGAALGADFLRATLDDEQHPEQQPAALFEAWQRDDAVFIENLVQQTHDEIPALYDALLARRNRAWLPLLETQLQARETQLIIVGAAHLYGTDGLISLLRERGYTVRKPALVAR